MFGLNSSQIWILSKKKGQIWIFYICCQAKLEPLIFNKTYNPN